MPTAGDPRRRTLVLLTGGVVVFLLLLGGLQAFNTSSIAFLNPDSPAETAVYLALTVLIFLLLLMLSVLLLRNILKVYAGQPGSELGTRLRTRLVGTAVLIALIPAVFMFLFSYILLNRSMERWFSPNTTELHRDSTRVVMELAQYVASNARGEAETIASTGAADRSLADLQKVFHIHRVTLDGGFVLVYNRDLKPMADFEAPPETSQAFLLQWLEEGSRGSSIPLKGPFSVALLSAAQRPDRPVLGVNGLEYGLGVATMPSGKVVVTALPMPSGLSQTASRIRAGAAEYWVLFRNRRTLRTTFVLLLLLITVLVFFSSVWLALFLSKQITRPVEALAVAMNEIARGKYQHRVQVVATGEMADLVHSFNHMAADLDAARHLAETSQAQLTAANQAIEARRRELETIIETIPSGVVTLDAFGLILQSNRAFAALLGLTDGSGATGRRLVELFPAECFDEMRGVLRRGLRMGLASTEIEFRAAGRLIHLAVTSARLDLGRGEAGSVMVMEDSTELLRAQRQLAWKEVAQRVAHEIKNPLTPIALSAERIGRHLDRALPDSPAVIRKCSEVILGCVETLRTLVDQFSALAQFPAPQPRLCNINQVTEQALALFAGRLEGITVECALEPALPQVLADPEGIRRALANLIDNAAEAMQGSLLRVLGISTALAEDGAAVEVIISDTGHGLTEDIRERLFLPFYSTKHRGTGLGLSIAAKIIQEHSGSIRAESNSPKGARFLIRLPLAETKPAEIPQNSGGASNAPETEPDQGAQA
jgi:hypothetical protein